MQAVAMNNFTQSKGTNYWLIQHLEQAHPERHSAPDGQMFQPVRNRCTLALHYTGDIMGAFARKNATGCKNRIGINHKPTDERQ
ncbi:hypothetical protein ZHAS_00007852 [Anopheles sinensis]|uniref:Uncharacterized protein n=1 Tax=Anopheles sinensis TaxID=74873 RepID=A0A084VQY5_ANOSI|nr:hypothetical protein ZHAS_00007852 [Anopheles sinensis]